MRRIISIMGPAVLIAGCSTTTSFAPPPVAVAYAGESGSGAICSSKTRQVSVNGITRDMAGAYKLIDAYVAAYRCAAHAAADGRQGFEIPAFVSTTGAALATALGGGATFGILGTGANAAFTAGNKYWEPKLKSAIYDHALDGLLCVKTEAVGIPAYKFDHAATGEKLFGALLGGESKIRVTVEQQYFEMVSAAAFSIERILSQRLSNMAPVDASAVAAELAKAIEQVRANEKKRAAAVAEAGAEAPPPSLEDEAESGSESDPDEQALEDAADAVDTGEATSEQKLLLENVSKQGFAQRASQPTVDLDLAVLKPKLDECVIRAKL